MSRRSILSASVLEKLRHRKELEREQPVSRCVPYTAHVDPYTVATKNGQLAQAFELRGLAHETMAVQDLNHFTESLGTLWRAIASSEVCLWHHVIRRPANVRLEGTFASPFAEELDRRYLREHLGKARLRENVHYLTVVRRPRAGMIGGAERLGRLFSDAVDRRAAQERRAADLQALEEIGELVRTHLEACGPRRLGIYETPQGPASELLEFLGSVLNQEQRPMLLSPIPLDRYLPTKTLLFGPEALEIRGAAPGDVRFGAMIAIKEYGPATSSILWDGPLRLEHDLCLTQTFEFVERPNALAALALQGRRMRTAEDEATTLRAQLHEAADALASGEIAFGNHHMTLLVTTSSPALAQAVSEVVAELTHVGIVAVRSGFSLEADYWAQLPGNSAFILRRSTVSTANWSCFASFHSSPRGQRKGHWGPPITYLETTSGTPYAFQFHHADVGNFVVLGPTGSGKTVLVCTLLTQAQRAHPDRPVPRVVYFDRDQGAEIALRALGGSYLTFPPGRPSGCSPLWDLETPGDRTWARDWIATLVRPSDGTPVSPQDREIIGQAVEVLSNSDPEYRSLGHLRQLLMGHERQHPESVAHRLGPWCDGGDRAYLFDHKGQTRWSFSHGILGFDLTHVLDDPIARVALLSYLLRQVEALLDGSPTILFVEEAWSALGDPFFRGRTRDWLKTIRKKNGIVGFGSQSAQDFLASGIADSIIEQCPTRIWLPNSNASEEAHCQGFGLTRKEFEIVRTLPEASRCFLIQQGRESVIARLDLSGMDDLLRVLSGRKESVARLDAIRARVGDDPEQWLPILLRDAQGGR